MFLFQKRLKEEAGLYMRLSVEDADKPESDSIKNQRELLRGYVSAHPEIKLVDEYVDDGYTGTNFERPDFKRMIKDCETGRINCIIVKDLSRLGRDFIGTGKLIERFFPKKGIRFIAVNDNYDNAKEDGISADIVIPFKNLINDSYSRDISTKIRSQLAVKCRNGEFIGNYAPYGYRKDSKNHNHLVVDHYAAAIVRDIFQWKLEGMSAYRIADRLNRTGVIPPSMYKCLSGETYKSGFKTSGKVKWQAIQVIRILTNEVYLGTMVQGKRQKVNYKMKKIRYVAPEQWIRVEGTHEAIISRQLFDTVGGVLRLDTRSGKGCETVPLFSGMVECGNCQQSMVRRMTSKNGKKYYYLHCSTYKNHGDCTSHLISETKLYNAVLKILQDEIRNVCKIEEMLYKINNIPREWRMVKTFSDKIKILEMEIDKYSNLCRQVYNDMLNGIVNNEEYLELNRNFTERIETARAAQQELHRQHEALINVNPDQIPWIEIFKKYKDLQKLDRRTLVELIEKIIVVDKEDIKIRFRFHEEIENIFNYCKECMETASLSAVNTGN